MHVSLKVSTRFKYSHQPPQFLFNNSFGGKRRRIAYPDYNNEGDTVSRRATRRRWGKKRRFHMSEIFNFAYFNSTLYLNSMRTMFARLHLFFSSAEKARTRAEPAEIARPPPSQRRTERGMFSVVTLQIQDTKSNLKNSPFPSVRYAFIGTRVTRCFDAIFDSFNVPFEIPSRTTRCSHSVKLPHVLILLPALLSSARRSLITTCHRVSFSYIFIFHVRAVSFNDGGTARFVIGSGNSFAGRTLFRGIFRGPSLFDRVTSNARTCFIIMNFYTRD